MSGDNLEKCRKMKKVELHVHLDGSFRPESIFYWAKKRNVPLPVNSVEELKRKIVVDKHGGLPEFLDSFSIFMPAIAGDEAAIRQVSWEFCEDMAAENVRYFEARFSPHLLASSVESPAFCEPGHVTPERVVQVVSECFKRAEQTFKVKARIILCCITTRQEWCMDVVKLCHQFAGSGVVGVDLAGDEVFPLGGAVFHAFKEAKRLGIHRTVHACESGPASHLHRAVDELFAERIGHGYNVLQDENTYERVRASKIHLECCPYSSIVTGSVKDDVEVHPIKRFACDSVNFGISTDDPGVIGKNISENLALCLLDFGLSWKQLLQSNLNAAAECFLPAAEKEELINELTANYLMLYMQANE